MWLIECSRLPTVVNCLLCSQYYLGFRQDLYSTSCCTFCTELSWPSSLTVMDSACSMSMTHSDTSLHQHTGRWPAAVRRLTACLVDIEARLKASQLLLNPTKTQVMWLGSWKQLAKVNFSEVPVVSACINVSETVCNLGVIVERQLTLSAQVVTMCCSGYYQLRQLQLFIRLMSSDAVKTCLLYTSDAADE